MKTTKLEETLFGNGTLLKLIGVNAALFASCAGEIENIKSLYIAGIIASAGIATSIFNDIYKSFQIHKSYSTKHWTQKIFDFLCHSKGKTFEGFGDELKHLTYEVQDWNTSWVEWRTYKGNSLMNP